MLQQTAVDPFILELIKELQSVEDLSDFVLVGGTALAIHLGHRKSIDIDLFSLNAFNAEQVSGVLEEKFNFQVQYIYRNTLKGIISGVFVDLITHNYPLIKPPLFLNEIKIASPEDIAAMKVNAISGDGTRMKDFIDLYFLLNLFSFDEIVSFFSQKYCARNEFHAVKSLTYFEDVDISGWPEMIKEKNLTFSHIRKKLITERDSFLHDKIK
jgi:hypothetical protein